MAIVSILAIVAYQMMPFVWSHRAHYVSGASLLPLYPVLPPSSEAIKLILSLRFRYLYITLSTSNDEAGAGVGQL